MPPLYRVTRDPRLLVLQRPWAYFDGYSAPTTLKSRLTNTWCGQLTPM
jgi:hypothetical protein